MTFLYITLLLQLFFNANGTLLTIPKLPSQPPTTDKSRKHIVVIGAGFSGLTAANELAALGYRVTIHEKASQVGGRAHRFTSPDGLHTFDAGPSWYWMPEIFDAVFERYSRSTSEFYNLTRLDPAYRVILNEENHTTTRTKIIDVPGTLPGILTWADTLDPTNTLRTYFKQAKIKYQKGIWEWIWKPMVSWYELMDVGLLKAGLLYDMFGSFETDLNKHTSNIDVRTILKWPVIFIGASPADAPSMYSLMTYAGHALGTWYPDNGRGMAAPAESLATMARETGHVKIKTDDAVKSIQFNEISGIAEELCTANGCEKVDGIVASADYHYVEQNLLPKRLRKYDASYWSKETMSPSCLLFYLGFGTDRLQNLLHHTFFFDQDLDSHLRDVFVDHVPTTDPTFYVTWTTETEEQQHPTSLLNSKTNSKGESLFVLVPVSYTLDGTDTEEIRRRILKKILNRMKTRGITLQSGKSLEESMTYTKMYGPSDFAKEYNAFRGNAFGLANTLSQSLVLKPSIDSLSKNLVFAGHLTNPGPGVPPAMVSGIVAARRLHERMEHAASSATATRSSTATSIWFIVSVAFQAILYLFLLFHTFLLLGLLFSRRVQSWAKCIELLYVHGRTYFAASTLMNRRRFLDTAAMYSLFRVADDYVDTTEGTPETRRQDLHRFIHNFWKGWESKSGNYSDHPVLPAVIEASHRNGYSRDLFERFFKSMLMDANATNICHTMKDTLKYMEGSAAVIGDFMVPLLMNECTDEERAIALPHARDLGNAFQLTNMIRDVGEDLDLGRQYVPEEMCQKFGIRLKDRDCKQPNFNVLMEELFTCADNMYVSADIGIGMLPKEVREVIKVARVLYHQIHEEIRKVDYDIFNSGRIRVKFKQKVAIATKIVPKIEILRIVLVESYFFQLRVWLPCAAPLFLLFVTWWMTIASPGWNTCSYLMFHVIWTIPCLFFLLFAGWRRASHDLSYLKDVGKWTIILAIVAFVWTTPWDNYLVKSGVWGYGNNDRVLLVIGYVPIEEYMFFIFETVIVCLIWLQCAPDRDSLELPPDTSVAASYNKSKYIRTADPRSTEHNPNPKKSNATNTILGRLMLIVLYSIFFASMSSFYATPVSVAASNKSLYLTLILIWSIPILIIQWTYGYNALLANSSIWCKTTMFSTLSLALADRWAIKSGIWSINEKYSLCDMKWVGLDDLPLEEFTFFLVTSLMCTWGLTLAMVVSSQKKRTERMKEKKTEDPDEEKKVVDLKTFHVHFIQALWHVYQWDVNSSLHCLPVSSLFLDMKKNMKVKLQLKNIHAVLALGIGGVAIVIFGVIGYTPSYIVQAKFLLVTSLFLGIPHGALDPILVAGGLVFGKGATFGLLPSSSSLSSSAISAETASSAKARTSSVEWKGLLKAWIPYLSLMVVTYLIWLMQPAVALFLFIIMSIIHFGEGDVCGVFDNDTKDKQQNEKYQFNLSNAMEIFVRGGAFLIAVTSYPEQVEHIFNQMVTNNQEVVLIMQVLFVLGKMHLLATVIVVVQYVLQLHENQSVMILLEIFVVQTLFRISPPLVAFGIYFNFFHSLRHIVRVGEFAPEMVEKHGRKVALLFTLLAITPMLVVVFWNTNNMTLTLVWIEKSVKIIFMGLSILTTPHMILVGALHMKEMALKGKERKEEVLEVESEKIFLSPAHEVYSNIYHWQI